MTTASDERESVQVLLSALRSIGFSRAQYEALTRGLVIGSIECDDAGRFVPSESFRDAYAVKGDAS